MPRPERVRRRLAAVRAGGALWLSLAGAAAQGETLRLPAFSGQPQAQQAEIDATPILVTHGRPGPAGWITCRLRNPDDESRELDLRLTTYSERVQVLDHVVLAPGEELTRHYPVSRSSQMPSLMASCDGGREMRSNTFGGSSTTVSVLLVTPRSEAVGELQAALTRMGGIAPPTGVPTGRVVRTPRPPSAIGVVEVHPEGLPEAWTCFAGFDAVAVDGRSAPALASQQALVDAALAGAVLVVLWADLLGEGPLRAACEREDRLGFGACVATAGGPAALDEATAIEVLRSALRAAASRTVAGPAPDAAFAPLDIPGLGDAPVGAFFLLMTLFVVLAGPVNLFVCKRAKRPLLVAATLPALGLSFAAAILLWGVLADGLGVRGAVRSLTWLDQRQHVAVNQASRTLFAGLTPASLAPAGGTLLTSLAVSDDYNDASPHRYVRDHARGGRVGGGILPGRWQTHFVTTSCQRVRERLRFRRLGDGRLEALFGEGLVPVAPGVAVRDHAGRCYYGEPAGDRVLLAACADEAARSFVAAAWSRFVGTDQRRRSPRHVSGALPVAPGPSLEEHRDLLSGLPSGSYLAWVGANAAFDAMGLDVQWDGARHLVIGWLAEEDFVD